MFCGLLEKGRVLLQLGLRVGVGNVVDLTETDRGRDCFFLGFRELEEFEHGGLTC